MHSYDNEYYNGGFEHDHKFDPGSNFEMENFESEYQGEYALNPEFGHDFQPEYDFEDEAFRGAVVVRDHRSAPRSAARPVTRYQTNSSRAIVTVPTRYNTSQPYYQQSRYHQPYTGNNYYYRRGYMPGHHWNNRYHWSAQGMPNLDQGYDQTAMPPSSPATGPGNESSGYLLDTIRSLSQQIATTNANVDALQKTISSPGSPGGMPPGMSVPNDSLPPGGSSPSPAAGAGSAEFEMGEYDYEMGNNNEMEEMEMAAELLGTNNDMELDHFLGGLLDGPLKGLVHGIIKKALPIAGAAAGTFFGGPVGSAIGEKIGSAASGMFGLELEGLSNEDQEFEVARAIVRLATDASRALAENDGTGNPNIDARNALISSAMQNAPGLLVRQHGHHHHHHGGCR